MTYGFGSYWWDWFIAISRAGRPHCLCRAVNGIQHHLASSFKMLDWYAMSGFICSALSWAVHTTCSHSDTVNSCYLPSPSLPFLSSGITHTTATGAASVNILWEVPEGRWQGMLTFTAGECRMPTHPPLSTLPIFNSHLRSLLCENCCLVQNAKKVSPRIHFALSSASIYRLMNKNVSSCHL